MMSRKDINVANLKKYHNFRNIPNFIGSYNNKMYRRDDYLCNADHVLYNTGNVLKFTQVTISDLREIDNNFFDEKSNEKNNEKTDNKKEIENEDEDWLL